jgi:hypothetical protein
MGRQVLEVFVEQRFTPEDVGQPPLLVARQAHLHGYP